MLDFLIHNRERRIMRFANTIGASDEPSRFSVWTFEHVVASYLCHHNNRVFLQTLTTWSQIGFRCHTMLLCDENAHTYL